MTILEDAVPSARLGAKSSTGAAVANDVHPFRFGRRDHLINLAFWTLLGAVTAANLISNDYEPGGERRPVADVIYWLLHSCVWAAVTPLIFWLVWRFNVHRGHRLRNAVILVGVGLGLTALVVMIQGWLWQHVRGAPLGSASGGVPVGWLRIEDEVVVCAAIFLAAFLREQLLSSRSRDEQAMRFQARAAQLQAQLAHARLAVLRSQLNPHFLFNSLNALSALLEVDTGSAQRMLARISELLRYALEAREEEEIPLQEELHLTGLYLEILEIRFAGRLSTRVTVAPEATHAYVPSLVLQPLVENAMKHGVGRAGGRGHIEVEAYRAGESLVLKVSDTGGAEVPGPVEPGMEGSGTGLGLQNTRARLRELYGSEQCLQLTPGPGGGMIAEVTLPFRAGSEDGVASRLAEAEEGAHA